MLECTENMDKITLSPTMSAKVKNRDSAKKIRHGSPKLQEVLRERCRQRMREKRGQLFNRSRSGLEMNSEGVQDTLANIVRTELSNIATNDFDPAVNPFAHFMYDTLSPEYAHELETEILNEEEEWIYQEYEKMSQKEIEFLANSADEEAIEVICPKCQKSTLTQKENMVACKSCDFLLSNYNNAEVVGYLINKAVNIHCAHCRGAPGFLPISENDTVSLYLVCDECLTWAPVL